MSDFKIHNNSFFSYPINISYCLIPDNINSKPIASKYINFSPSNFVNKETSVERIIWTNGRTDWREGY